MAIDPATIGAAGGAFLMAAVSFLKVFKTEKRTKAQNDEVLEALKIVKDIFQPPANGNGKDKSGALKSDGIPGFAPECLERAKDHGERIATLEADNRSVNSRFDGLNSKIESFRREVKVEFADLRREIRRGADAA